MSLQYPIGEYDWPSTITSEMLYTWMPDIELLPARVAQAIAGLNDTQLDTPYRPQGWTIRQVIHHLADSHMNSYIRFKLALTEDAPTIRPYEEALWAELPEARDGDPAISLDLLVALHRRWVIVLNTMGEKELARTLSHHELGPLRLDQNVGLYAWHGNHHLAHITETRDRLGW
ncbi:MAG: bacillithiol transferase BstA [Candidatus Hydrogenedentota bacterium]